MTTPYTYIIGPTVGIERLNIDTFLKVREVLKATDPGQAVVIPHELFTDDEQRTMSIPEAQRRRCEVARKAAEVRYIGNWHGDRFAELEILAAKRANKLIRPFYMP